MVTATKTSDTTQNSTDVLSNKYKSLSSKSTSELYKANNGKTTSNDRTSKSEDFKEILSSKTKSTYEDNKEDTKNVDSLNKNEYINESKDTSKLDEVKEKLEELEEESKSDSNDKVNDILTELLNLLAKLGVKEEDLKLNGDVINSNILKSMIQGLNGDSTSKSNSSSIMDKLMELLKNDSVKGNLDTNSLKSIEKLLSNLSSNLVDDKTGSTQDIKSGLKNLMSEISNILDSKQNQNGKVLTLEDMLNKNYSQENKESSNENQSNSTTSKDNKEVSKEDKFLNSLIDDDKDSSLNKINLFASRTQTIQNQSVDTVRGLTINKATFADDLIKDVKFMSNNGLKELTLKVNPGNLGEITIKLVQEDGILKANLKANSKETSELLSQNLTDIKKQLGDQNIKIADVNIELYQDDTTFFKEQGFGRQLSEEEGRSKNSNTSTGNELRSNEEDLINNIATNDNNIEFFA
jgi:flagellar hook-length control protein FliK